MSTLRLTMSQALVKFLDNQYLEIDGEEIKFVEGVFGIFGHGCVVGIGEALQEPDHSLKFYQGHSEQGMGHAAIAFAKQNNRKKILAVTSSIGPGALNMVTAAGTATANHIPVLFLPGDVFACRQPDPVLQQIEIPHDYTNTANDAFRAVCRYWDRIVRPEQVMSAALNAMRVLTDPADTGAVCLALPQDVQAEAYDYPDDFFAKRVHRPGRRPLSPGDAERAAELIKRKKKPMIICGGGVRYSAAGEELAKFASDFDIPFAETQAGKGVLLWDNPLNLGGIGVTGTSAANEIAHDTDLVIALGTRLNDFTTASKWDFHNPEVELLSINVSAFDAYKMNGMPLVGDAKLGLADIRKELGNSGYKAGWGSQVKDAIEVWTAENTRLYTLDDKEAGFAQTKVMGLMNEGGIPEDAIVVAASGSLPSDMQRLWRTRVRETYHLEYAFSCMGYEIAGALGAKIACPEKEVYCILGDGSFWMLNSEMFTAVQEGLKINIILIDNNGFHCIDNLQASQGIPHFGCEFRYRNPETGQLDGEYIPVDYAAMVKAVGFDSYRAENSGEFSAALEEARAAEKPVLIDCKTARKSMTGDYGAWWRVGTPEVSRKPAVVKASKENRKNAAKAKQY
ncbi:MAG: 3D-(3,5/4)-trihydroxycyclohexane-1,2-dione acylhydrolase (decyclizing) [Spirochaetes bacterium]|nr:MAG: 3D-(3,5/4)-trihydroxycyclohexane-1,2-dione acylhydrolase (decyclizing) [Spirochaetota bacterium]